MAGLYIHIPFCKSRCIYCGFYSTTDLRFRQRYVDSVCSEMVIREPLSPQGVTETVYVGGGTPSQLSLEQLQQLFRKVGEVYDISKQAEVTIEVNPDDVTPALADWLPTLGVNRVSMGAQTFDDSRLHFLHRRHQAAQVSEAVRRLRDVGIVNISVDLMYGFPDETLDDWQFDIDTALALDVEHISAYCLMVEEDTLLHDMIYNNVEKSTPNPLNARLPDEELERQMYEVLIDRLTAAGYEHYELSNFALPGHRSLHNSNYWKDIPYTGLGAAAHSYDGRRRSWNVSDIRQYMEGIEKGQPVYEWEELDVDTYYNDRVTVALRTCEGLCLESLSPRHRRYLLASADRYLKDGLMEQANGHLRLTRRGLFVSDMVMADLMMV